MNGTVYTISISPEKGIIKGGKIKKGDPAEIIK